MSSAASAMSSSGDGGSDLAATTSGIDIGGSSSSDHHHHHHSQLSTPPPEDLSEIGHAVFTALPPGSVSTSFLCSFLSSNSKDVIIVKSNRIEVRSYSYDHGDEDDCGNNNYNSNTKEDQFPLLLTLPINGRIVAIAPIRFPSCSTSTTNNYNRDCLLFTTEKGSYALISYDESLANQNQHQASNADEIVVGEAKTQISSSSSNHAVFPTVTTGDHYPITTHASGNFQNYSDHVLSGGRQCECGPLLSIDPLCRCVAMHLYDGYLTVLPINKGYEPFEEGRRRVPWGKNNSGVGGATTGGGGGAGSGTGGGDRVVRRGLSTGPFREAVHLRLEERTILSMTFLEPQRMKGVDNKYMPQLAILHQDCYGYQHVVSHGIDLQRKKLVVMGANMDNKLVSIPGARGGRGAKGKNMKGDEDGRDEDDDDDDGGGKPAAVSPTMPPPGEQLKISKIEGGSGCLIAVPPPLPLSSQLGMGQDLGGVLVLGQRLVTYHSTSENVTLRSHTGGALLLSWCRVVEEDSQYFSRLNGAEDRGEKKCTAIRYLVGDERGRIHLLSLIRNKEDGSPQTLLLDTLGTVSTASSLVHLGKGRVFVGSSFGNSQLVKILDDPVEVGTITGGLLAGDADTSGDPLVDTTFLEVLEEYDNLGPIVDFDLRPCSDDNLDVDSPSKVGGKYRQSLVVTCSGVSKDGTVRLVRNGVGMLEHASVDIKGIKGMWSLRRRFHDDDDAFLVQSFVRETRILGVQSVKDVEMEDGGMGGSSMEEDEEDEEGGALAEVTIPGFSSSKPTLFSGNMMAGKFDLLLQVVDDNVRVVDSDSLALVTQWSPFSTDGEGNDDDDDEPMGFITVASANESGQIVVALRGGVLVYLMVEEGYSSTPIIHCVRKIILEREISCVDLNPFGSPSSSNNDALDVMDIDNVQSRNARKSSLVAVGLWDDFSVRLLNLKDDPSLVLEQVLHIHLGHGISGEGASNSPAGGAETNDQLGTGGQHLMARSLCLVTMDSQSTNSTFANTKSMSLSSAPSKYLDMILVGLGDGRLISFVLNQRSSSNSWTIHSRKEVSLGTQGLHLIPFQHGSSKLSGSCVLATGDRPTVVYLTGGNAGSNSNPKLSYSTISLTVDDDEEGGHASHRNISVNVATPFRSSLLFSAGNIHCSSFCMADENTLRLGMIDNIEKLHVTTFRLGMTPRRIAYHSVGRVYCVGCIAELELGGEANQNNCVRFFDDSTFEELNCIRLEPFEMILTIESVSLGINSPPSPTKSGSTPIEYKPFIVMGTAYAYPDEDEPSQGRVLVVECNCVSSGDSQDQILRQVRQVADLPLMGGIYSIAPFYGGTILVTCGSDTILCQLCKSAPSHENGGKQAELLLNHIGSGHHGHLISLFVKSLVSSDRSLQRRQEKKQRAIVGDLMRSISLVEYHPKHQVIEEIASDFNSNFCTEVVMLTDNIFMGSEGHNNLFVLQYNSNATTEQARIRLDTVGQYHLGENVNKMIGGSLVMPSNIAKSMDATLSGDVLSDKKSSLTLSNKIDITIGSQTLYGTVDGTIGSVLGLSGKTFAFMSALQRAMDAIVRPVGDLSHAHYRAWQQDQKKHRACGFVDGDWIETFLDLNRPTMERVVKEMNIDPRWSIRDNGKGFTGGNDNRHNFMDTSEGVGADPSPPGARVLSVDDVLCAVEELSMLH